MMVNFGQKGMHMVSTKTQAGCGMVVGIKGPKVSEKIFPHVHHRQLGLLTQGRFSPSIHISDAKFHRIGDSSEQTMCW